MSELNTYLRGWAGYFARFKDGKSQFEELDSWIRRRIRQWKWVGWKTKARRYQELCKGGVDPESAKLTSCTVSHWRASHTHAVHICLSNERIRKKGFKTLQEIRQGVASL